MKGVVVMSRVIFKMTFQHPNLKQTVGKNMGHIDYIATRPGADKSITEKDLQKELSKGSVDLPSDDSSYIQYIDQRPRSHGLFGQDGIENPEDIKNEISNVKSFVWRGIISLKEEDAIDLGYIKKDQWQDMLRKKMPDIANEMGIPISNLRWVGAVHMEKGHPHAHVVIWENEPKKPYGILSSKSLDRIRKTLTDEIFEEERFQLLNDKNVMRELINDLAKGDMSKATILVKEVRATELELKAFATEMNQEGVSPKLYSEEETYLANRIASLSQMLPGKGRANLAFMPEDVKTEVRGIADFLLQQPMMSASLEKNLRAVEELTRMYTGKEDAIQKARDNAYNEMRDRIGQVVLKGAVESLRENVLFVDHELSQKAISFISNLNNAVDLIPEQTKVMNQIGFALLRTGFSNDQAVDLLKSFSDKEGLHITDHNIKNVVDTIRNELLGNEDVNVLSSSKVVDRYLSSLKIAGFSEADAFSRVRELIDSDSLVIKGMFDSLVEHNLFSNADGIYKLTDDGVKEVLKIKELDSAEKEILKALEGSISREGYLPVDLQELIGNKNIFSSLRDKDPEEFNLGKFDAKIRSEFGEFNSLSMRDLEDRIYEKYTNDNLETNDEKAEQEFESLKYRIEKLALNGYVSLDKESGIYSFTDESNSYFKYDPEDDSFKYTDSAIELLGISKQMEFSKYDASVTLRYIDQSDGGILSADDLDIMLHKEIVNKNANAYYDAFSSLLGNEHKELLSRYIVLDDDGIIRSTQEGKWLGIGINQVENFIKDAGDLKIDLLSSNGGDPVTLNKLLKTKDMFNQYVKDGVFVKAPDSSEFGFVLNPVYKDINSFLYQIYKNGGEIARESLRDILDKNVPNVEAEKQFKYLSWRLENLKVQGFLVGEDKKYSFSEKGLEKRADILVPQRVWLKKYLKYLNRLGLVSFDGSKSSITDKYFKFMKSVGEAKESGVTRESSLLRNDLFKLLDRTQDSVDIGKIERSNMRIVNGKFLNNEYSDLKTSYSDVRTMCGVNDSFSKVVNNLSTTLLISGVGIDDTKAIIQSWNLKGNNNDPIAVNEIIDKAHKAVADNNLWGNTTIISKSDWKEMFELLGVPEKNMPKWIYKGENWQSFHKNMGVSIINDLWKSTWKQLERQRMQTQAQAEHMKKQLFKQQSANQSVEAMKEQARKNKSNSLYRDDELEM